jgi:hypothetical protein
MEVNKMKLKITKLMLHCLLLLIIIFSSIDSISGFEKENGELVENYQDSNQAVNLYT